MYIARLSRPDLLLLATAYLATKAQHPKEGNHNAALIISCMKATINHGIKTACQELKSHLHCDASSSWASHHDDSSHTENGKFLYLLQKLETTNRLLITDQRSNNCNS